LVIPSKTNIVQIDYLRKGDVWDFTVDKYANYFIGDILNHNTGKTYIATFILACHLMGKYPAWWKGHRFTRPIKAWLIGESGAWVRDNLQPHLLGEITKPWTGWLKEENCKIINKPGMPGAVEKILVTRDDGEQSVLQFMSYDQDEDKFTSAIIDFILFDEEPPQALFGQALARTLLSKGKVFFTFTPEHGQTPLYCQLNEMAAAGQVEQHFLWVERADHIDMADLSIRYAGMTDEEKEARMHGIAVVGSGKIFQFEEREYVCDDFEIPRWWPRIGGLDIGGSHPTGATALAIDPETKSVYVYREMKNTSGDPKKIAWELKPWKIKFATSPDAWKTELVTARKISVASIFQDEGLEFFKCDPSRTGITLIKQMISEGRWWIFKSACPELIKQMSLYRYKETENGKDNIYKVNDDIIDSARFATMALDKAELMTTSGKDAIVIPAVAKPFNSYSYV